MKKRIVISAVLIFVIVCPCLAEKAVPEVIGSISSVIVYRGQALVTRKIETELPKGSMQLIVKKLPAKIVPESLYAQASGNVTILSVRYRQRAVEEDIREEVKQLDAQIENVAKQLLHADGDLRHLHQQWGNMFCKLREFTVNATKSDLNRGLLTFEPIKKLTTFIEEKGIEYHKYATELRDEIATLKKELELLNRKREELAAGSSPTEREVVLFVSSEGRKKATIELSYLVNGANWLPQYNLRANPDKSSVLIEYNAVVNQTSGEDWDGVGLSLSTAEPTMVAAAPSLKPMTVTLTRPRPADKPESQHQDAGGAGMFGDVSDIKKLLNARRKQARKGKAAQRELGRLAVSNQMMELKADSRAIDRIQRATKKFARREGVSVTYNLGKGLSMPSRSDQQLVTIATDTVGAGFTLVATPLLTDYVYLQAELLNDSDTVLLPGQASMFRNGEFVGKSRLSLVTAGEKFTAGFGIDSQLQVTREIENKKTRIQGGNRIDTYHYRIALSNYKTTAAGLRLLDRLPNNDKGLIKIELLKTEPELSKDSEYLRTTAKKGILRWDMELMPNTIGENATVVTYSFTMEYDKNMQIKTTAVRN